MRYVHGNAESNVISSFPVSESSEPSARVEPARAQGAWRDARVPRNFHRVRRRFFVHARANFARRNSFYPREISLGYFWGIIVAYSFNRRGDAKQRSLREETAHGRTPREKRGPPSCRYLIVHSARVTAFVAIISFGFASSTVPPPGLIASVGNGFQNVRGAFSTVSYATSRTPRDRNFNSTNSRLRFDRPDRVYRFRTGSPYRVFVFRVVRRVHRTLEQFSRTFSRDCSVSSIARENGEFTRRVARNS